MILLRCTMCLSILVLALVATPLFVHYAQGHLSPDSLPEKEKTDAVMVFTGSPERLVEGYTSYIEGDADKLMISGFDYSSMAKEPKVRRLERQAKKHGAFYLDLKARNTIENARNGAQWALKNKIKSIQLVTTEDHMPRAFFELRRLLPDDVEVYANAIPGNAKSQDEMDTEKNRLLCRLYETAIDADFCYQTREFIRTLDDKSRS